MFRPVAALTVEQNRITVDWENIKGATNYDLELYKVVGTDETTGESIYEETPCATGTCTESPYTFSNLDWDERYIVRISCSGGDKSSEQYETTEASVTYLTKLTGIRSIDNAVRITWDQGGSVIKVFKVEEGEKVTEDPATTPDETAVGDVRLVEVSDEDYAAGTIDIVGLNSETAYTFTAYSDAIADCTQWMRKVAINYQQVRVNGTELIYDKNLLIEDIAVAPRLSYNYKSVELVFEHEYCHYYDNSIRPSNQE